MDWTDRLKYMEMEDILDIDIQNIAEEFEINKEQEGTLSRKNSSIIDDTLSQYL